MTINLMPGESREEFDHLCRIIRNEWKPSGDHENFLVDSMISARLRLERLARWEAEAMNRALEGPEFVFEARQIHEVEAKSVDRIMVEQLARPGNVFEKIERYTRAAERAYSKAVKELQQHRAILAKNQKQNEATARQNKAKDAENWLQTELANLRQQPSAGLTPDVWDAEVPLIQRE